MKIGIFDSGVGGITVLKEALKQLPQVEYVYYSDNLHVPYGTKTKEEVLGYVSDVVDILIDEHVDAIVIACNTATSIAADILREKHKDIPIIGMEPAVKLAVDQIKTGRVLVTATPLTLKEEKYKHLVDKVDKQDRTDALALPELVQYAEHFEFDKTLLKAYFDDKFSPYNLEAYNGIVLGCTHFVYFKNILREILPKHIKIYDGNEGTIRHLKELLHIEEVTPDFNGETKIDFYYSGQKNVDRSLLEEYLNIL